MSDIKKYVVANKKAATQIVEVAKYTTGVNGNTNPRFIELLVGIANGTIQVKVGKETGVFDMENKKVNVDPLKEDRLYSHASLKKN